MTDQEIDQEVIAMKKKYNRMYLYILLISFICSIPFNVFLLRADWNKDNSIELLQQKNPSGYTKWQQDRIDPTVATGETPEMRYFNTPFIYLSAFLSIPFYCLIGMIILSFYWLGAFFMWLPRILQYLIVAAIYLATMLYAALWLNVLVDKIKGKSKIKTS